MTFILRDYITAKENSINAATDPIASFWLQKTLANDFYYRYFSQGFQFGVKTDIFSASLFFTYLHAAMG